MQKVNDLTIGTRCNSTCYRILFDDPGSNDLSTLGLNYSYTSKTYLAQTQEYVDVF